jgi:O-antigen/teichoic acid export membrane protein
MAMCLVVYFIPTELGELLLGDVWEYARPLILPFAVVFAMSAFNFGAQTGLRLIGEAGRSFRVRAVITPMMLVAIAVACIHLGVTAAVWAQAIGSVIAAGLWWGTFVLSHRRKFLRTSVSSGRHRR